MIDNLTYVLVSIINGTREKISNLSSSRKKDANYGLC